jgi:hypothetical protein
MKLLKRKGGSRYGRILRRLVYKHRHDPGSLHLVGHCAPHDVLLIPDTRVKKGLPAKGRPKEIKGYEEKLKRYNCGTILISTIQV